MTCIKTETYWINDGSGCANDYYGSGGGHLARSGDGDGKWGVGEKKVNKKRLREGSERRCRLITFLSKTIKIIIFIKINNFCLFFLSGTISRICLVKCDVAKN